MADFCRECSIELFGKDYGDLRGLGGPDPEPLKPGYGYPTICEGCGYVFVDEEGVCLGGCLNPAHKDPREET